MLLIITQLRCHMFDARQCWRDLWSDSHQWGDLDPLYGDHSVTTLLHIKTDMGRRTTFMRRVIQVLAKWDHVWFFEHSSVDPDQGSSSRSKVTRFWVHQQCCHVVDIHERWYRREYFIHMTDSSYGGSINHTMTFWTRRVFGMVHWSLSIKVRIQIPTTTIILSHWW